MVWPRPAYRADFCDYCRCFGVAGTVGLRPAAGRPLVGGHASVGSCAQPGSHSLLQLWLIARIGYLSADVDVVLGAGEEPVGLADLFECSAGRYNSADFARTWLRSCLFFWFTFSGSLAASRVLYPHWQALSLLSQATLFSGRVFLMAWAPWLPASLTPFLNAWRQPQGVTPALNFQPDWITRLYTLLEGLRFHFVALVGPIVGLVLWPARKAWKNEQQFRSGVFLAVLFFLLLGLHVWAGLGFNGVNYGNAYTVNPYIAFFSYIGLLLTVAVFSNFQRHPSAAKQIILSAVVILISTSVGYGGFINTSDFLLHLRIPRIWSSLNDRENSSWRAYLGHSCQ